MEPAQGNDALPIDIRQLSTTMAHIDDTNPSTGETTWVNSRYEKLREHAGGEMGQVWVALDREFNREVAFKEIRDQKADANAIRTGFVLEAEVTGQLEHPGIVPVYSLGKDSTGRPYYAMRFIRGTNLAEQVARFHSKEFGPRTPAERSLPAPRAPGPVPRRLRRDRLRA